MSVPADIEFVDELPGEVSRRTRIIDFVEVLKTQPGRWALYPHVRSAGNLTHNRRRYPGTEWASRRVGDEVRVFARWVGEDGVA